VPRVFKCHITTIFDWVVQGTLNSECNITKKPWYGDLLQFCFSWLRSKTKCIFHCQYRLVFDKTIRTKFHALLAQRCMSRQLELREKQWLAKALFCKFWSDKISIFVENSWPIVREGFDLKVRNLNHTNQGKFLMRVHKVFTVLLF